MGKQLLLLKDQVPIGAEMFVCTPGTEEPLRHDEYGPMPPLFFLWGGVPIRAKWYMSNPEKPDEKDIVGGGYEFNSLKVTNFVPAYPHSPESAPIRKVFAVFIDGKRLEYDRKPAGEKCPVKVAKTSKGELFSASYRYYLPENPLPKDAILVVTSRLSPEDDFNANKWKLVPKPEASVRVALEDLGIVFYDYANFFEGDFCGYIAAKLPAGWNIMDSDQAWLNGVCYQKTIYGPDDCPRAVINQKNHDGVWVGKMALM